ncbi:unnamed protein product [Callosobruchus maculatus]|uniref:Uncharacterized protein n=1 Tax=Callosobruchus maculatus TaxID=64391 RepID=A0A653CLE3_CALMS|nr:unnamed protein product [Callosobruchus maculatus]
MVMQIPNIVNCVDKSLVCALKLNESFATSPEDPVAPPPKENTPAGLAAVGAEPPPPKLNTPDCVVVGLLKVAALAGGWAAPKELLAEPKEPDAEEAVPKEELEGFENAEAVLEPKAADEGLGWPETINSSISPLDRLSSSLASDRPRCGQDVIDAGTATPSC